MTGFDISTAQGIYLGGNQVQSLYLGSTKIWPTTPTHDYSQDYLTIERINNAQGFEIEYDIKGTGTLQYSIDGLNWYNFEATHGRNFFTSNKLLIKGNITPSQGSATSSGSVNLDLKRYGSDISSVKVYGNPLSIIYGDNFAVQSSLGFNSAFEYLFKHSTSADSCLVDASNLYLGFGLSNNCFVGMFSGCSNLINPPELPATTLTSMCYLQMFEGCTSLTTAPELPATTLAYSCYSNMFKDCTSLNYIKCLATDISASSCTTDWVSNVAATGTFIKDTNTTWSTGVNGIPSGWTVIDAN